jgi:hypothetical protein
MSDDDARHVCAKALNGDDGILSPMVDRREPLAYGLHAMEVRETGVFSEWLFGLRDARAKADVARRVRRLALGNPGDVKPVGAGVSELRIHCGPG